jgi:hypothetical protein
VTAQEYSNVAHLLFLPSAHSCVTAVTQSFICRYEKLIFNRRARRRTPMVYDIYALDHFIELVEKIERNVSRVLDVATYIRQLGYDSDYWTTVVG